MGKHTKSNLKIGLGGLGAVGLPIANWLNHGVDGLTLAAISAKNRERAKKSISGFLPRPRVVKLKELANHCDVVVECAPPQFFEEIAESSLRLGRILIPLSVTSLLPKMEYFDLAKKSGAKIIIPSGAMVGLDAVRAASYGTINYVVMKTRKPPMSIKNSKFVQENKINLDNIISAKRLFKGSVREAARLFPANVNITVALAFSGIGPDRTQYEIWCDPDVDRNCHTITVDSDSTRFEISIAGVPTEKTPGTGKLTPLSVMSTLEGLVSHFKVGN